MLRPAEASFVAREQPGGKIKARLSRRPPPRLALVHDICTLHTSHSVLFLHSYSRKWYILRNDVSSLLPHCGSLGDRSQLPLDDSANFRTILFSEPFSLTARLQLPCMTVSLVVDQH
ncbi:hypothetical protein PsYK624_049940 [Phanerochaete sordida]|uniref:Uncharacterized protein n=1 Tax=Phanerochaete sordida TaxID=48140 RepID=A0A9P3G632_9APHY|nr:hypothetical protein PsYK624_049940 [Phanerochaete sordida]